MSSIWRRIQKHIGRTATVLTFDKRQAASTHAIDVRLREESEAPTMLPPGTTMAGVDEDTGIMMPLLTRLDVAAHTEKIQARYLAFRKHISARMTTPAARAIRALRVDQRLSWRGVAEASWPAWGGVWAPPHNQIAGNVLCDEAARRLREDPSAEPWN